MINAKAAALGMLATLGLSMALTGCAGSGHPIAWEEDMPLHEHPYQPWWSYEFIYHADRQVYYEPYSETYFWFERGLWEEGSELPANVVLTPGSARTVKLQNRKPYVQHATVLAWHPNYYGPVPGSTDRYHRSPDAIAMSEQRAAIRIAQSLDELMEIEGFVPSLKGMSGQAETGSSDSTNPESDLASAEQDQMGPPAPSEVASASSSSPSSESSPSESSKTDQPLLTGVDTSSDNPQ